MNVVGKDFGAKKIFLPQVMLSAEAMREAFIKIKERIPADSVSNKGTIVIATVKGDIHDLGKNIVSALLENNGFKVIDLLNKSEYSTKVMIGGAVVTQEYADNVGANAYAPDGVEAVEIAKKLINK